MKAMRALARTTPPAMQGGLTLVELMISLAIGLLITLAIGYLYTNSRQTYRMNDNIARMQENGRLALELISRDLRMAGYWGCASRTIDEPVNTLNNRANYAYRFEIPIEGHEANGHYTWAPPLPADLSGVVSGSDVLTLRNVYGSAVTVLQHPGGNPPGSADLKVSRNSGLRENDIVLVSDCSHAAIFQITNINTAGDFDNVVHNTGTGSPGNANKDLGKEYTGGMVQKYGSFTYYIGLNPAGRPTLYREKPMEENNGVREAEELVENVENMQVTYGVNTDRDPDVDQFVTANNVTDWKKVRAVQVRLLLVSPDDNLAPSPQTYRFHDTNGDGLADAVTATDRRLRYVFTSTVGLRNRLP